LPLVTHPSVDDLLAAGRPPTSLPCANLTNPPSWSETALAALGQFGKGGLTEVLRNAGVQLPDWSNRVSDVAQSEPFNTALGITTPMKGAISQKIFDALAKDREYAKLIPGGFFDKGGSNYRFTTPSGQKVESYINPRGEAPGSLNSVGFQVNERYGRRAGSPPRSDFMDILRGVRDHVSAYIEHSLQNDPNFKGVTFHPHGGTSTDMEAKNAIYGKFAKAIAKEHGLEYVPQDISTRSTTKTLHKIIVPERPKQ
jgi:hypothetical protein